MIPRTDPDRHLCVLYRMGRSGEGPIAYRYMTYGEQAEVNQRLDDRASFGIWVNHDFFQELRRRCHGKG